MALEMQMEQALVVTCQVEECTYNQQKCCTAHDIKVGDMHPTCDTFQPKQGASGQQQYSSSAQGYASSGGGQQQGGMSGQQQGGMGGQQQGGMGGQPMGGQSMGGQQQGMHGAKSNPPSSQVATCKVQDCTFNQSQSCQAPGITVAHHGTHADCETYREA